MIVKFINLSYLSLWCYNEINYRNILFHCFKLPGYRQLAMTHAHRDEIVVVASQTTPNRIRYIYPSDDKKYFCNESNNFRNMKLIIS
jgi:hypothetical protein